jgi:hypothetical protein
LYKTVDGRLKHQWAALSFGYWTGWTARHGGGSEFLCVDCGSVWCGLVCACCGVAYVALFYVVWRGVCSVVLRCFVLLLEVETIMYVIAAV